jgi:hypothetical protein
VLDTRQQRVIRKSACSLNVSIHEL